MISLIFLKIWNHFHEIFLKRYYTNKYFFFEIFVFSYPFNMLQLWEQYIQVHAVSFCFNMLCIHKHKEILQAIWINFTKISEEKKISTCETYSMLQMQWHTYTYYMIYWFRNTCTRCRIRRNIEMIRCSVSRQNLDISTNTTPNIHSGQKCKNNAILWWLDILFCQISTFVKVRLAIVFGVQIFITWKLHRVFTIFAHSVNINVITTYISFYY